MSQVATDSSSSSQSSLMTQRVHSIDSNGVGSAESALPLKSIGLLSHGDPCPLDVCHPRQQSRDGVRRSRRLVERSTKVKRESTGDTNRRRSSRPHSSHSNHSSLQASSSSASSFSSTANPGPSHLPTNKLLPGTTTSSNGILTPSPHTAPESSALTRSDVIEQSSAGDDQSDTMSTTSTQAQAGSPPQLEHSYALTFSSIAEEIPLQTGYLEATPHAPPLSRSREATPHASPLSRSREATPHTSPTSVLTTTLNAPSSNAIPVSVIQTSIARDITRETNSSRNEISRTMLPPYMLSTTSTASSTGHTGEEFTQNGANLCVFVPPAIHGVSVPTEHAQNDRFGAINDDIIPLSNSTLTNHPRGVLFDVPMPVPLAHYPMGSGVRRTVVNNLLAEQTERERQRLEQSTAFIASRSQDRSTLRRRRGRRRDNEQMDLQQVDIQSSTRRVRDRSPITRQHTGNNNSITSSSQQSTRPGQRGRRTRPPPLLNTEPPPTAIHVPLPSSSSQASSVSDPPLPQYIGYQIVPQVRTSTMAGSSGTAINRTPLPHMHLSHQRQISMPGTSNIPLQFQMPPRQTRSVIEPVVQLASPGTELHVPLSVSHSGSPSHPPSTSPASYSGVPFHPSLSPHRTLGGPGPISIPFQPIAVIDSPHQQINESAIIVASPADHEVPRSSREIGGAVGGALHRGGVTNRRQSHVEVIVVDSSDSEHEDDDDVIVSGVSRAPSFTGPSWSQGNRRQISSDEALARRLQEEFDQELHEHFILSNQQTVPAVPAGPSIPLPRPRLHGHTHGHTHTMDSGSLIRNNYEALVSHVERLTHTDAMRMLNVARSHAQQRMGRRPRTPQEYARVMESMGDALLFSAIMGPPGITSYEDLLELAETLGPARPQGLPQDVINNLRVKEFKRSLDTTASGELPKCVVCMCDFEEREKLRILPCDHEFHQQCIDQWLKDHRTCPICRVELHVPGR